MNDWADIILAIAFLIRAIATLVSKLKSKKIKQCSKRAITSKLIGILQLAVSFLNILSQL